MSDGPTTFIQRLTELGLEPVVEAQLIIYRIEPVDGVHAGHSVVTGVETAEVGRWPLVPPHWIHLPSTIQFAHTNSQPSPKTDWTRHSRQISRWGQDADPVVGWAGHVRSVIGAAIT